MDQHKKDKFYKADLSINEHDIKPSKTIVPKGYKKVWIEELAFWVIVKKNENDQDVIKRTLKKYKL